MLNTMVRKINNKNSEFHSRPLNKTLYRYWKECGGKLIEKK
jgi:hypothetical protein